MSRNGLLALLLAAALAGTGPAMAATHHGRHARISRYAARHHVVGYGYGYGRPYASRVSPSITCHYPDGTPLDPDIIGGINHVGDGGPAANLGGFDPCGY